jgi:hypothetical protein
VPRIIPEWILVIRIFWGHPQKGKKKNVSILTEKWGKHSRK